MNNFQEFMNYKLQQSLNESKGISTALTEGTERRASDGVYDENNMKIHRDLPADVAANTFT